MRIFGFFSQLEGHMLIIGAPISNGVANRVLFSDENINLGISDNLVWDNSNKRLGIGITNPTGGLHLHASSGNVDFRMSSAAVAHPFTGIGFNPEINSNVWAIFAISNGDAGGIKFTGLTDSGSIVAATLRGYIGSVSPTQTVVSIEAAKSNGGDGATRLTGTEKVFDVRTNGIPLTTVTGNGDLGIGTIIPNSGLEMGNDKLIAQDVNSGLTAGTTQTQAGGLALTAQINQVSTVANTNDTAVLPVLPATGSIMCGIINDGANAMRIFPGAGDNLGAGVNTQDAVNIPAGTMRTYISYDGTNWRKYLSE